MPLTQFQIKKEEIKNDTRLNKYSVHYMDNIQKPEAEHADQINGNLFTGVETAVTKYYGERTKLNGRTVSSFLGAWNSASSTSPWMLSITASNFGTFPTLSHKYTDLNVYKPSKYVWKNGQSGSGQGGLLGRINTLASRSDQLVNGWVFSGSTQGTSRWQAPSGTTITLKSNPNSPPPYLGVIIYIPGSYAPLPTGKYYIEANGVNWFGTLAPKMQYNPHLRTSVWAGYYIVYPQHQDGDYLTAWAAGPHDAVVRNYYIWSNSQRTTNNDWWSNQSGTGWSEFPTALNNYYTAITSFISDISALIPTLTDIIDYYKGSTTLIGSETELNWQILGGIGTWDDYGTDPNNIAVGWTEVNNFHDEATTGGGSGSWTSQLTTHLPEYNNQACNGYSNTEINAVNAHATDFQTKINNRIGEVENDTLGALTPATADGAFSKLRAIRYLWVDSRINKSGGTLVQKQSTYNGISILTKKCNLLNNQLTALNIPNNEREPRTAEVDCSRMEFTDKIVVKWKMVMQATQYSIHRFDAGTGDAGRLYNQPDGPADNLFALLATIDATDADDLPVTKYDDEDLSLQTEHFYYYKIKAYHDGKGFPPPYDENGESQSPEDPTEGFLSLNFYDTKVWRAIVGGVPTIKDGFLNSGAIR